MIAPDAPVILAHTSCTFRDREEEPDRAPRGSSLTSEAFHATSWCPNGSQRVLVNWLRPITYPDVVGGRGIAALVIAGLALGGCAIPSIGRSTLVGPGVQPIASRCNATKSPGNPGDPDGRDLCQLVPVHEAVPRGAHVAYMQDIDSQWDSCDGIAGTFSWDDPVVNGAFTTSESNAQVLNYANRRLSMLGWGPMQPWFGGNGKTWSGATWEMRLANGTVASAQIAWSSPHFWELDAEAPSIGPKPKLSIC